MKSFPLGSLQIIILAYLYEYQLNHYSFSRKGMRRICILISLFFIIISAFAQTNLSLSRTSSYYTYIYQLTTEQASEYYLGKKANLFDALINPIDSFITDSGRFKKSLKPGVYLEVSAKENKLNYKLKEYRNAYINLFDNNNGLAFSIHDLNGILLTNIKVYLNDKKIDPNGISGIYRKKHFKKESVIRVDYNGTANFFPVTKKEKYDYNRDLTWRNTWDYLKFRSPFGLAFKRVNSLFPNKHAANPGYIAFNKPVYKPGDTVRLKAFLFNKRRNKPIAKKTLYLSLRTDTKEINLGELNPYRDGAYETSIVLHDSMELKLDKNYTVFLRDNMEFGKSHQKISSHFRYEDYELKSVTFSMRTDRKEFSTEDPLSIYFKAIDENGLAVPDGRVILNVINSKVNAFADSVSFIPDTIFSKEIDLDPIGETKFLVPDSLMPNADINLRLEAKFLNSNNEKQNAEHDVHYLLKQKHIHHELRADSLILEYREKGKSIAKSVFISATNKDGDTILNKQIELPASVKVSPAAEDYAISYDGKSEWIFMENYKDEMNVLGYRTKDSVFVSVSNPRNIFFSYSLYLGNRIIKEGSGKQLEYVEKYSGGKAITCVVNYLWAGESEKIEQSIVLNKRVLNMIANQPLDVYPGKETDITIKVTDYKGMPVSDVDITAYAFTTKFKDANLPFVPSFGEMNKGRKDDEGVELEDAIQNGSLKLKWDKWGKELGLDSITYFKFTHPKDTVQFFEKTKDSSTQIAPFAILDGDILPIHFLYIDEIPVFSSQTDYVQNYSFTTGIGKHSIKIRTLKGEFIVNDIQTIEGHKLTLSINVENIDGSFVKRSLLPDTLTPKESNMLSKYFFRVVDNFNNRMFYLQQDSNLFLFKKEYQNTYPVNRRSLNTGLLAGPLKNNETDFVLSDNSMRKHFLAEGGYSFEFKSDLIKQKSLSSKYAFSTKLTNINFSDRYKDFALQKKDIEKTWETYIDLKANTENWFNIYNEGDLNSGKLSIKLQPDSVHKKTIIRSIIVYKEDDANLIRILPGDSKALGSFYTGDYRILILLANDRYLVFDNINIKPFGVNYYELALKNSLKNDSRVQEIWQGIKEVIADNIRWSEIAEYKVRQSLNDKFLDTSKFENYIQGKIVSKSNEPLSGVSIRLKGTNYGTSSDLEGNFSMFGPLKGRLVISYIGFQGVEVNIGKSNVIQLDESLNKLEEVVVVGYGTPKGSDFTGMLAGRVAGIAVRGTSSKAEATSPLIIVNGLPFNGKLNDIEASDIKELNTLKADEAIAIYGSRALGGVILITTNNKSNIEDVAIEPTSFSENLRKNFSDYAFWQPQLITNEKGEAKFKVTFPDDITNWKTFAIGVNRKMTGVVEGSIRSYKTLSANIALPQFSIDGDSFNILGKILSYTPLEVKVQRQFKLNDEVINTSALTFKNSLIDTFIVNTNNFKDSINAEYSIRLDNGYFDGELRSIPIYKAGVIETKGLFEPLVNDTAITFSFDPKYGKVKFNAVASLLPVLEEEFNFLRNYEYSCNEQLASKLIGLLAELNVRSIQKETFKEQKQIGYLIKKLNDNQRKEGTWGWWPNSEEEYWISSHVVDALLQAEEAGFNIKLDKQKIIDRLVFVFNSVNKEDQIKLLDLLKRLNSKVDFPQYIRTIEKNFNSKTSDYDQLRLLRIKQELGEKINIDSLLKSHRKTMLGNIYFGEVNNKLFDNAIQNSLIVYNILKRSNNKYDKELISIRNFFLEQRSTGRWRNTYETALILNTIVPDIIKEGKEKINPVIQLKGQINEVIDTFPYTNSLESYDELSVVKTGKLPIYITAFQQFWNKEAENKSVDFEVKSYFKNKHGRVEYLEAGEEVELIVEVTPRADADYVQIEIPIPAGCSYESKTTNRWGNVEIHREYFKNKVSIFCNTLKPRRYEFSIKLIPRYNGTYTLNPAKAEMMYFPTFFGREGIKKVVIK